MGQGITGNNTTGRLTYSCTLFHMLRYIHFLEVIKGEGLPTAEILNHVVIQPSPFTILLQALSTIHTSIR